MINLQNDREYIELKKSFDSYYGQKILPLLQENDKIRYRYLFCFFILLLMSGIFYPLIVLKILSMPFQDENISLWGWIICLSGFVLIILNGPMYFYRRRVKPQIMPVFAGFFGNFRYEYEQTLSDAVLQESGLFATYNQNIGDDCFFGVYDDVHMTIAEEKLRTVHLDEKKQKHAKNIFSGVCILLEMNKNFSGKTIVLEDKGIFNPFQRVHGLEHVKLEDSKFEKLFEVYADNQIEARYLLTTAFMERMLQLQGLYEGKSLQFSFQNNQLLIAIRTKQNMFEANSFFRSNINPKRIQRVFEQFYTVFSIIRILKLNQHIGV